MAKLSKEELINKINETSLSDEEKISFMEDVTDSFIEEVVDTEEVDKLKAELEEKSREYDDLKNKYKDRFLGNDSIEVIKEKEEIEPEMEEKEYVDIKDIFTKKEE